MNAGGVLFFLVAGAVRACIDLMVLLLLGVRWLPGLSACLLAVNHCEFNHCRYSPAILHEKKTAEPRERCWGSLAACVECLLAWILRLFHSNSRAVNRSRRFGWHMLPPACGESKQLPPQLSGSSSLESAATWSWNHKAEQRLRQRHY